MFEPQGVTGSPSYGCVGLTMENKFEMNVCGEYGSKRPKTQHSRKQVRLCKSETIFLLDSIIYSVGEKVDENHGLNVGKNVGDIICLKGRKLS